MNARQVSDRCRNVDGYSEVLLDVNGARFSVSRIEEAPSGVPGRKQILLVAEAVAVPPPAPQPEPEPEPQIEPDPEPEADPEPEPRHGRRSRK